MPQIETKIPKIDNLGPQNLKSNIMMFKYDRRELLLFVGRELRFLRCCLLKIKKGEKLEIKRKYKIFFRKVELCKC